MLCSTWSLQKGMVLATRSLRASALGRAAGGTEDSQGCRRIWT